MPLGQGQEARVTAADGPGETWFVDTQRTSGFVDTSRTSWFVGALSDSQFGDVPGEGRP